MIWFPLSISAAFSESTKDVFCKKVLSVVDEYVLTWASAAATTLFLIPLLFITKIPSIGPQFWLALIVGGSLNTIAAILYLKAIKLSDLSVTVPITNFTPLFLLLASPLIVHEVVSIFDVFGSVLIIVGSYVLNLKAKNQNILVPFQAIWQEPGPRLMLLVAFIWSITSSFDKVGVQNSSPVFWLVALHLFIAIAQFPIMLYKSPAKVKQIPRNLPLLLPIGLINCLTVVCQMTALTLTLVVHVISIKRLSALMSVLLGASIFKEKNTEQRLTGAAIMVLGVLCIAWS